MNINIYTNPHHPIPSNKQASEHIPKKNEYRAASRGRNVVFSHIRWDRYSYPTEICSAWLVGAKRGWGGWRWDEKKDMREGKEHSLYSPCVNPSVFLANTATNPLPSPSQKHRPTISQTLCGCALFHTIVSNHRFVRGWKRAEGGHVCPWVDWAEAGVVRCVYGGICGSAGVGIGMGTVAMTTIDRIPRRMNAHVPRGADE
jgi:hypothetical protein